MSKTGRPFIFCRYSISTSDEVLNSNGQFGVFQDLQGQYAPITLRAERNGIFDSVIMRPQRHETENYDFLTWSVGRNIKFRMRAKYDPNSDALSVGPVDDDSIVYTDFISIPHLGVMAVDDRAGEMHLGGKSAINRFKAVIRSLSDMEADVTFIATPQEVQLALKNWSLTKFKFTIQPNNPRPVSRLAETFSNQMKSDGIGKIIGTAKPNGEEGMHMAEDGFIVGASDLIEAGYGQMAVEGYMPNGLRAEIKKPRYSQDRRRNEAIQEKPREIRVYVEDEDKSDQEIMLEVAEALAMFHSNDT